jgi:hypothetical protein
MADPKNTIDKRITPGFLEQAGKGRPKGVPNKNTTALKDMILQALNGAGGVDYLIEQAEKNPGPFMALVGKVLPMQVTGENGDAVKFEVIARRVVG